MNHEIKILPSLLSSNFANLEADIKMCQAAGADILHVDVMDGHFVPNITIGPLIVEAIRPATSLPIDCHLMIEEPDRYIEDFARAGADYISVHAETASHLHRTLSLIKSTGVRAGVALNPVTPLSFAMEAAEYCDFILLMSVNPGFGGQSFIPSFLQRAEDLREFLDFNELEHVEIEVDGGVKVENAAAIAEAGASMIVSGSGLFSGDFEANIRDMRRAIDAGRIE